MTTILIVDDEPLARERLAALVTELQPEASLLTAPNVKAADELLHHARPPVDLVLLDIQMPGDTGLDWLQRLNELAHPPAVIMTTAWADYALSAIQQGADGYLLKPVKAAELAAALERARRQNRLQARRQISRFPLNADGTGANIDLGQLCYCAAETRWVRVVTADNEYVSDRPLKDWAAELAHLLVPVHRSYLVSLEALEVLERDGGQYRVRLKDGTTLPVSRRHARPLRERLSSR